MVKIAKKFFTFSVVAMTIMWSVGLVALVPTVAMAEDAVCPELEAGDLFKVPTIDGVPETTAVYLLNADMERMWFPNGDVYYSWYEDTSGVETIPSTCVSNYPQPTVAPYGVNYKPGSTLVKQVITKAVYLIETGNKKTKIGSEEVAAALYGADWSTKVRDFSDIFWSNFTSEGAEMTEAALHNGMTVTVDGITNYTVVDGILYEVDGTPSDVQTVSQELVDALEMAETTVTSASLLANPTQTSAGDDADDEDGDDTGDEDVVVADGDLTIALAANTPNAGIIPFDVQGVTYMTLMVRAGDEDVEITGLTVERAGLGESSDFDRIYASVDGVRAGNKRTLGSDDEVDLYFNSDKDKIVVPANSYVGIDVVVDMGDSGTSGNTSYLRVTAVETTADVDASFPVSGNAMSLSGIEAPFIDFEYSGDTDDLNVGDEQVEVAEFTLDGDDSEDVMFYSITLKQEGSAGVDEVVNYTLYNEADDVIAGPVDARSDDYVVFELDSPFLLEEDENNYDFTVKADIIAGNGETVDLQLDEATDLYAVGEENEYTSAPEHNDAGNSDAHSVDGGALTISEHDNNPNAEDYAEQATDVLLLVAELEAEDETVVVTSFPISITNDTGDIDVAVDNIEIEDFHVTLDGSTVCGKLDIDSTDYSASTTITVTCDDEFEVSGTQELRVTADFTDEAHNGYTVAVVTADVEIEDLAGDELYSTGVVFDVSGSAEGGEATIDNGVLSLSEKSSYTNRTITAGATAYKIGSYVLKAPSSQGVNLSNVNVVITGTYVETELTDLFVSVDPDVTNNVTADEDFAVNVDLADDETLTIDVFATLDDTATGIIITTLDVTYEGNDDETEANATSTGQTVTVAAGSLADAADASTPDADIVIGGSTNVEVYSIEFDPTYDTYVLTELNIDMSDASAVTALHIGDETVTEFPDGIAAFTDLSIAVPAGGVVVEVFANFNIVDTDIGLDSGVTTTFGLESYSASADEGTDLTDEAGSADDSEVFELRNSRPTLAFNSGAESAVSGGNGLLSLGDNQLVEMTVLASNGTVDFKGITADLTENSDYVLSTTTISLLDADLDVLATTTYAILESGWDFSAAVDAGDREIGAGDSNVYYLSIVMSNVATDDQVTIKVTDITWDDDIARDIDGTYIEQLPSAKYISTQNS